MFTYIPLLWNKKSVSTIHVPVIYKGNNLEFMKGRKKNREIARV